MLQPSEYQPCLDVLSALIADASDSAIERRPTSQRIAALAMRGAISEPKIRAFRKLMRLLRVSL